MSTTRPVAVIVMAAGAGTRMRSATSKVLHTFAGRSLLEHGIVAAHGVAPEHLAVVVRHERDAVIAHVKDIDPDAIVAEQDDIPGTGRAVWCALTALDAWSKTSLVRDGEADDASHDEIITGIDGPVVITSGDVPLLDSETLRELVAAHCSDQNAITVLSTEVDIPYGYGRIVREPGTGKVLSIVEEKDASEEQRAIREINGGVYVFDAKVLRDGLTRINQENASGEMYLTDVIALAVSDNLPVRAIRAEDPWVVQGVNDRVQLAQVRAEMNRRILDEWMMAGVTIVDPASTWIDVDVDLAQDVVILPGTQLHGATTIGAGSVIGPDTTLTDVEIGRDVQVIRCHGSLAVLQDGAQVGPFSYLRPGTVLGPGGKIGTFVETKNAQIGAGSKVPHLTYVGDATVGEQSNVGAGTIFANYDGVSKHRSTIGSHVRTGAHNVFVAPIEIGDGAYTGAGTVVRRDVPAGALGITDVQQRNIERWVLRRHSGTAAAEAGAKSLGEAESTSSASTAPPSEKASQEASASKEGESQI